MRKLQARYRARFRREELRRRPRPGLYLTAAVVGFLTACFWVFIGSDTWPHYAAAHDPIPADRLLNIAAGILRYGVAALLAWRAVRERRRLAEGRRVART